MSDQISKDASDAWRDHVLKQVVVYLERNRDEIIDGFEAKNAHNLKREDIEHSDLLDFDVSVTLHRDQSSSFGLGFGFFQGQHDSLNQPAGFQITSGSWCWSVCSASLR